MMTRLGQNMLKLDTWKNEGRKKGYVEEGG
jgi:hypothetical protein